MKSEISSSSNIPLWLVAVGVIAAVGFFVGIAVDLWWLRIVAKPWPVLCLIVVVSRQAKEGYRNAILAGLIAGVAGDMLLEWSDQLFTAGLIAFLIGHLCYVWAFAREERGLRLLALLPFAAWIAALLYWLWPSLGAMQIPVLVYSCVIGAMMWRALAMRLGIGSVSSCTARWTTAALVGAVLFATSDSLIAASRFHGEIEYVRYPIILLYWTGQLGIALSVIHRQRTLSA